MCVAEAVVEAIDKCLPKVRPIGHHEPYTQIGGFTDPVSITKSVDILADGLRKVVGVTQAVPVSSGTAALHLILLALGAKPGHEVIVPALTFVATANAVSYTGATPHFVDASVVISPFKLRAYLEKNTVPDPDGKGRLNPRTKKAISIVIVTDLLGFPADWAKLTEVTQEYGLELVEDAAQALGASYGDRKCGSFGRAAAVSFNNNKIITGFGGGAVLTNDEWVAARAWDLATTARIPHQWEVSHSGIAYNYRCSDLTASVIVPQLENLPDFMAKKRSIFDRYKQALQGLDVKLLEATKDYHGQPNHWLTTMKVPAGKRDLILQGLHDKGICARAIFKPLSLMEAYINCPKSDLGYTVASYNTLICLPSGLDLA